MGHRRWLWPLLLLLTGLLCVRVLLWRTAPIEWDAAVYAAMAKHIASLGTSGFAEWMRPPLYPALAGLLWRAGVPIITAGQVVSTIASLGACALLFAIARRRWGVLPALAATGAFGLAPLILLTSAQMMAEALALLFILLAVWAADRQRWYVFGLALGLALTTKLNVAILIVAAAAWLLPARRCSADALLGLLTPLLPYLLLLTLLFTNPLRPLIEGWLIVEQAACAASPPTQLLIYLGVLTLNVPLIIVLLAGLRQREQRWSAPESFWGLSLVLGLLFFALIGCPTPRYAVILLPFAFLLLVRGWERIGALLAGRLDRFNLEAWWLLLLTLAVVWLLVLHTSMLSEPREDVISFETLPRGPGLVMSPYPALVSDAPLIPLYYDASMPDAPKACGAHWIVTNNCLQGREAWERHCTGDNPIIAESVLTHLGVRSEDLDGCIYTLRVPR